MCNVVTSSIETELKALVKLAHVHSHDPNDQEQRIESIRKASASIISRIDSTPEDQDAGVTSARLFFWKGQALDIVPGRFKDAENALSKAIKLDPNMVEAWNLLGNGYWKTGDLQNAKNCFLAALDQQVNSASLRDLSMILRSIHVKDSNERLKLVTESVRRAHEAVKLDMKDSKNWYNLGNAYLTEFFCSGSDHAVLNKTLKAYQMAERFAAESQINPDLYFNRANVRKFQEDYAGAVTDYQKAGELDASLPAAEEIESIERLVTKLSKIISTSNGIKAKRLSALCKDIPEPLEGRGDRVRGNRDVVRCDGLAAGHNNGKMVVMKIVAPINKTADIPISVVAVDKAHRMVVVSLYNVAADVSKGFKVGDILCIMDPHLKNVQLGVNSYTVLQITQPKGFIVNGRILAPEQHASAQAINQVFRS